MAEDWTPLSLDKPLFANLDEDAVVGYQTAIENGFINELGGHTRFPGLVERVDLGGNARVYLNDFKGDLIAGTSQGQIFRINRNMVAENVTAVPVAGGRRVVFTKTDRDLLAAAGGPIVRLRGEKTEILSESAPDAALIGNIDNFIVAVEINSGRFFHANAGRPDVWDPLDTFAADGQPDNINSLVVTPYRELLLGGEASIEQFERLTSGTVPFFRRWAIGEGVKLPYAVVFADGGMWAITGMREFAKFSGQQPQVVSAPIAKLLEGIDDWTDAWMGGYPDRPLSTLGQRFIVFQAPNATNAHGSKGVTLGYDYRNKRFFSLYGWDTTTGTPSRWPGWSHWRMWDREFVGGEGKIYELTPDSYCNGGDVQRWLVRTSHMAVTGDLQVKDFRLRLKRGIGTPSTQPTIQVRCSLDAGAFGPWVTRGLGKAGDRMQFIEFGHFGTGSTFMFEIMTADDCAIDLIGADVKVDRVGH